MTYGGCWLKIDVDLLGAAVLDRRRLSRTRFSAGFLRLKDVQSSWLETCPTPPIAPHEILLPLDVVVHPRTRSWITVYG